MRLRFSLRFLLLFTLLGAVGVGVGYQRYTNPSVEHLVDELNSYELNVHLSDNATLHDLRWTVDELNLRHLGEPPHLLCVGLTFERVDSRRPLFLVSQLPSVKYLNVREHGERMTPKRCDFSHLETLEVSGLSDVQLTDWLTVASDLQTLKLSRAGRLSATLWDESPSSATLTHLSLTGMEISSQDLINLRYLPRLETLELNGCTLQPGSLTELPECATLKSLRLSGKLFGDEVIATLQQLGQLETLRLDATNVTNRGVAQLSAMSHLRALSLAGCQRITRSCVPDLKSMRSLRWLDVRETAISKRFPISGEMGHELR
ncbi:MAG: hypothetical protein AAFU85_19285 [Planctomycetota bacterium]